MNKQSLDFLKQLLKTPSPSGFEERIQAVVKRRMKDYADTMEVDLHGNLIVGINTKAKRRVMLAGHCDQIGFMVRHIDKDGYLYLDPLGGIDEATLWGSRVTVHTKNGPVHGVFGKEAIHNTPADQRSRPSLDLKKMWVDIGAKNKKEAEKLVSIADPVTYFLEVHQLGNDLICSPGLDDKVGLFVAMEALRLCVRSKLNVALYAVSTVQEEVGVRGAMTSAYGIAPEVGIAIDVCHASDTPTNPDSKRAPCKLGEGPGVYCGPNVNPVVFRKLEQCARKSRMNIQVLPASRPLGTDARAIQTTRAGVATAGIGVPNRNMHTQVELCSLKDIENCAKLIANFVKSISAGTSFIPR